MSDTARNYVKSLSRGDRAPVSSETRAFLFYLADYHDVKTGCAWPGIPAIAEDMDKTVRQIQRYLSEAVGAGLIAYTPGRGRGNLGSFIFLELVKGDMGVAFSGRDHSLKGDIKGDIKGDMDGIAIRKNQEPLNQNLTHPNPPFQGGNFVQKALTVRQVRHLNLEIYESMRDPRVDLKTAVETACARLLIPLDQAWAAVKAAGIGDIRKSPQSEIA